MQKINYFNLEGIKSEQDLKNQFKKLALKYHPDINKNPGANEVMKQVNAEFEYLAKNLKNFINMSDAINKKYQYNSVNLEKFKTVINKIVTLQGLKIEIVGSWIWLTGTTLSYRSILKEAGFFWSCNKKAWYWNGSESNRGYKGRYSLNQIRAKYGSELVETKEVKLLQSV